MIALRKLPFFAFLFLLAIPGTWALEIKEGKLKLVLHEGIGRFSMYLLTDPAQQGYTSLFVDQDPRTSGLALVVDNKIYKLGEGGEFQESVEKMPGGARFVWSSKRLTVVESFSFAPPADATLPNSLSISIAITNNTDRDVSVGVRFCLDTYLGEGSSSHFQTDRHKEINNELALTRENMVLYWLSLSSKPAGTAGLQSLVSGDAVTVPDKVVFANWKRMSESSWGYDASPARNFSNLPYSINDSAVCQYYDPASLPKQAYRTIRLVLAATTVQAPNGVVESGANLESLRRQSEESNLQSSRSQLSVQGDIRVINGLLLELERKRSAGRVFSDEEIKLMEEIMADIRNRLERYIK